MAHTVGAIACAALLGLDTPAAHGFGVQQTFGSSFNAPGSGDGEFNATFGPALANATSDRPGLTPYNSDHFEPE